MRLRLLNADAPTEFDKIPSPHQMELVKVSNLLGTIKRKELRASTSLWNISRMELRRDPR